MEHQDYPIHRLASFFDSLTQESLKELNLIYHPDVQFKDPINEASGLAQLDHVFKDLFTQLQDITIKVTDRGGDSTSGFIRWTMDYRFRRHNRSIDGVTHAKFDERGLITHQTDFWDASFPIYGEFPIVGLTMRGIRRIVRVRHPQSTSK